MGDWGLRRATRRTRYWDTDKDSGERMSDSEEYEYEYDESDQVSSRHLRSRTPSGCCLSSHVLNSSSHERNKWTPTRGRRRVSSIPVGESDVLLHLFHSFSLKSTGIRLTVTDDEVRLDCVRSRPMPSAVARRVGPAAHSLAHTSALETFQSTHSRVTANPTRTMER